MRRTEETHRDRFPEVWQESAIEAGTVAPSWRFGTPAILHDRTFAYRSDIVIDRLATTPAWG